MSSLCGPAMWGNRFWSAATISAVSSIESVVWLEGRGLLGGLYQADCARRKLSHGAGDFRMAFVPDQHDLAPAPEMNFGLPVHFGDERTCRIDGQQVAMPGFERHRFRHPMC